VNVQTRVHACLTAVVHVKLAWLVASPILTGDWCKIFMWSDALPDASPWYLTFLHPLTDSFVSLST